MTEDVPTIAEVKDLIRTYIGEALKRHDFDFEFAVVLAASATERPIVGAWSTGNGFGDEDARAALPAAAVRARAVYPRARL